MIVGMMAIDGNIYYDKTLKPQLKQIEDLNEENNSVYIGYKVSGGFPRVEIVMPKVLLRKKVSTLKRNVKNVVD